MKTVNKRTLIYQLRYGKDVKMDAARHRAYVMTIAYMLGME